MADIVVVGSLNMDIVTRTERFPLPGETLRADETAFFPGGKGANQAVAAARLGASVAMIGSVGQDPFGRDLKQQLTDAGIDSRGVRTVADEVTGLASITVDGAGHNAILVSPGANLHLSTEDVLNHAEILSDCKIALFQNEIDPETTAAIMHYCHGRGIRVFYNPAPVMVLSDDIAQDVDTLILNEVEAGFLAERTVSDLDSAMKACSMLAKRGFNRVLVTLGSSGSVYATGGRFIYTPSIPVHSIDTTAAGDTFIGAFAAALVSGELEPEAIAFATAAAALAVTKVGAQSSIPSVDEVTTMLLRDKPAASVLDVKSVTG